MTGPAIEQDPFAALIPRKRTNDITIGDVETPIGDEPQAPETTPVPPTREPEFRDWVRRYNIRDLDHPDSHYDYRGAFLAGAKPDARGHWPDPWKQHGHETFSQESRYSTGAGDGGTWQGEQFTPAGSDDPFASLIPKPMRAAPIRAAPPPRPIDTSILVPRPAAAMDQADLAASEASPIVRGVERGAVNVARGLVEFPLQAVEAALGGPTTPEELRNPLIRGRLQSLGIDPDQALSEALKGRAAETVTDPFTHAGRFLKGAVTMGYDLQRQLMDAVESGDSEQIARAVTEYVGNTALLGSGAGESPAARVGIGERVVGGARDVATSARDAATRLRRPPGAPEPSGPVDLDAVANEARELSILKTRTPQQNVRLRALAAQLAEAAKTAEPPIPFEQSRASVPTEPEPLPSDIIERERRRAPVTVAAGAERRAPLRLAAYDGLLDQVRQADAATRPTAVARATAQIDADVMERRITYPERAELGQRLAAATQESVAGSPEPVRAAPEVRPPEPAPVARAAEADPFEGLIPEAGAPHNEAAVQEGLFGERTLTGKEQGELIPETAGVPAARFGAEKIASAEEIARVRREGAEPPGATPGELIPAEGRMPAEVEHLRRHAELTAQIARDEQIMGHHTTQYTAEGFKLKGDEPHLVFNRTRGEGYAALGRLRQAQKRLAALEGGMPPEILAEAKQRSGDVAATSAEAANRKLNPNPEETLERAGIRGESEPIDQDRLFSPAQPPPHGGPSPKQPGGSSGKSDVPALIDISRKLAEAVQVPLRQGREPALKRMALGLFKPREEVTRVRRFDMLDTVVHEVGHYISKKYLGNPTMRRRPTLGPPVVGREYQTLPAALPKGAGRELVQMGKDLYGSRKPAAGYGEEGIAQWHRFYVTDPARMQAEAPRFTEHMDGILAREPALKQALDQAREDFARYNALPAAQRVANLLSVDEAIRNTPTVRSLMTRWLDDVYEFKAAVAELGGSTSPAKDAGVLARLSRGSAGVAEELLERGVVKYGTTDRVAPSVEAALRSVPPARIQAFREYLTAESALDRLARGINPGITKADATAIAEAGRPEFQKAADVVWQHYQALIDYRRDAGLLTDAEAKKIKETNPHHVSFYRVFEAEELANRGRGAGASYARTSSGVMRQKGSARRIVDPLESVLTDTYQTVAQVKRYEVMRELVRHARNTEGGGRIVEEIPAPKEAVSIPAEQVRSQLEGMGLAQNVRGEAFPINPGDLEGQILTAYREARAEGPAEAKDMVVRLLENGERRWYVLKDRALYEAVKGLNTPEIAGWQRWFSVPARTLRAGATLTLEFAFGRNPVRDAWSQAVFTKGKVPVPGVALGEGLFHYLKADEVYQRWRLEGGDNATMLGLDRVNTKRTLDRVQATALRKGWTLVRHPLDTLRLLSSALETATRVGEFAAVRRGEVLKGATPHEADLTAALAARDVTVDFAQGGTAAKAVNNLVWTFNASLRGTALLVNQLRERPGTVISRAAALVTIPSITLYLMQKDDPVYQDIPAWVRNVSWAYVQRGNDHGKGWDGYGTGKVEHVWVLPKSFELGILFGTVPERITEYVSQHKPEALKQMVSALRQAFVPPVLPTAVVPLIENYANRSFGLDRPIVPRGREALAPGEQTKPGTGATARVVGNAVGYSPAKIENAVRGYTGGLGTQALRGVDAAVDAARVAMGKRPLSPERRAEGDPFTETPILKGFTRRLPAEDSQRIEETYQRFQANEQHRLTWRRMIKEGRGDEARQYLADHRNAIRSVATAEDAGGSPGPLRAVYDELQKLQQLKRTLGPNDPRRQRLLTLMRRAGALGVTR